MMGKPLFLTITLVFVCLAVAVAQVDEPPLPPDLKIIPPGAGVPPRLVQLSGVWEGTWDFKEPLGGGGRLKTFSMDIMGRGVKIAIVEIKPANVQAVYAFSGSTQKPGNWFRIKDASISGDSIVLRWGQPGKKKTVTLSPAGSPGVARATLQAETVGHVLNATLRKK
jgi:hypothetical protein